MKNEKINLIIKNNIVVIISFFVALISCFFVKPDEKYLGYLDFKTLSLLFIGLAIVTALDKINIFRILSRKIIEKFSNLRTVSIALIYITIIGSMIITNDMALITFLPLGYYVLESTNQKKYLCFLFVMQNFAANLGGMLTPFGNPQNLFIYSYYDMGISEFISIMFLPFSISVLMITICCFYIPKIDLEIKNNGNIEIDKTKLVVYMILFLFFLLAIFKIVPYAYVLILVISTILILDFSILRKLDYGLLLTFFLFFIFAGNVARIESVSQLLSGMLEKSTLLTGIISSQFISNVPSAILLSRFTENYQELLVAVNIGGTGTLIASLASLITYKEYVKYEPKKQIHFIKIFSILNIVFLAVLTLAVVFNKL